MGPHHGHPHQGRPPGYSLEKSEGVSDSSSRWLPPRCPPRFHTGHPSGTPRERSSGSPEGTPEGNTVAKCLIHKGSARIEDSLQTPRGSPWGSPRADLGLSLGLTWGLSVPVYSHLSFHPWGSPWGSPWGIPALPHLRDRIGGPGALLGALPIRPLLTTFPLSGTIRFNAATNRRASSVNLPYIRSIPL